MEGGWRIADRFVKKKLSKFRVMQLARSKTVRLKSSLIKQFTILRSFLAAGVLAKLSLLLTENYECTGVQTVSSAPTLKRAPVPPFQKLRLFGLATTAYP